jgi:uncharacterized protein YraI
MAGGVSVTIGGEIAGSKTCSVILGAFSFTGEWRASKTQANTLEIFNERIHTLNPEDAEWLEQKWLLPDGRSVTIGGEIAGSKTCSVILGAFSFTGEWRASKTLPPLTRKTLNGWNKSGFCRTAASLTPAIPP